MLEAAGQAEYLGPLHTSGRCDGWWGSLARLRALRWGCVADVQAIRAYWGERVAFYFAWQSFYLQALTPTLTLTSNP